MLKPFIKLYSLNINKYVKKKPTFKKNEKGKLEKMPEKFWLDYLEWATVITLLYENGAEKVIPEFETNDNGYPCFFDCNNNNPFVKVKVTIDDNIYTYHYPVINGNKVEQSPNQMNIHKAQQRGLVKCIAINTGLGLKLWQKEEQIFDETPSVNDDNPNNLPELLPNTPKWIEAIKSLNNGYKIDQIKRKYYLTQENQKLLISESI